MSRYNPLLWPRPPRFWGYVIPVLSVGLAVWLARLPALPLQAAPVSLFICAIMVSAWFGGVGPGLFATVLSALAFNYFFQRPEFELALPPDELPRLVVFVFAALFVALLSAAQRSAAESLRRSRDELSVTVQGLKKSEQKIRQDEHELRQIIDLVPEHIVVAVPDGVRLYANQSFFNYNGLTMADVSSSDFPSKILHPDDLDRVVRERQSSLARGVAFETGVRYH